MTPVATPILQILAYDITAGMTAGFIAETTTDPKSNVTKKIYDKTGRMTSVVNGTQTTTYSYYNDGSKWKTTYQGGATEEYTYNADNLLYTLVNKKADLSVIDSYTYTYDDAHNMLTKVDANEPRRKTSTGYCDFICIEVVMSYAVASLTN